MLQEFETKYVADRGYSLHDSWGNSQDTTRHLQFGQFTRDWIEQTLASRGDLVGRFWDGVLASEPDPAETSVVLMRGFSILAACSIGLLERSDADLLSWLKLRRVLNHKQYAKNLRSIYGRL